MKNQTLNLFIVEDVPEKSLRLHHFLATRFGTVFTISTFTDAVTALSKVDENTSIVVLDYDYFGEEGNKIVTFITDINPKTKVIILANSEDIYLAITTYQNENTDFLHKDATLKKKLSTTIFEIITYPANYLQMKYSVSQFFIYLVFLFFIVGFLVFVGMVYIY
jgi:DNA-binding NtrC family response regulator